MTLLALHQSGNRLLDSNNNPVILRGVNSYTESYQCWSGVGGGGGGTFGIPHDANMIANLQKWDINVIRVFVNSNCWLNQNNANLTVVTSGSTFYTPLVAFINACIAANIYVIVVFTSTAASGIMADANTYTVQNALIPMLGTTNPGVLWEAVNEPHTATWAHYMHGGVDSADPTITCVGMQGLITNIRATGATQPILIDGNSFAGDFSSMISDPPVDTRNNLIMSWHEYSNAAIDAAHDIGAWHFWLDLIIPVYPILLTEYAAPYTGVAGQFARQKDWEIRLLDFCEVYGIGHTVFAWVAYSCTVDNTNYAPSSIGSGIYQRLQAYRNGNLVRGGQVRRDVIPSVLPNYI